MQDLKGDEDDRNKPRVNQVDQRWEEGRRCNLSLSTPTLDVPSTNPKYENMIQYGKYSELDMTHESQTSFSTKLFWLQVICILMSCDILHFSHSFSYTGSHTKHSILSTSSGHTRSILNGLLHSHPTMVTSSQGWTQKCCSRDFMRPPKLKPQARHRKFKQRQRHKN